MIKKFLGKVRKAWIVLLLNSDLFLQSVTLNLRDSEVIRLIPSREYYFKDGVTS